LGLSFALPMQRAERRLPGTDFRPRFAWRLFILYAIGWLHGLAYSGDILTVYAALGTPLVLSTAPRTGGSSSSPSSCSSARRGSPSASSGVREHRRESAEGVYR
jgi:hypothetical protein